jgi:hypothetical protein
VFHGLQAQEKKDTTHNKVLRAVIVGHDTLLISNIPEITIYPSPRFKNRYELWRYQRLVHNVKKAYPYAKMAGNILKDVDRQLAGIQTDRERKKYVNSIEDEIRSKFEDEVKKLTITQGRILIKLIDRETGNTTYDVLQTIKGNFSAVFWQAIARVFGSTLKSDYDPYGEDWLIEQIILMIDSGQL